MTPQPPPGQGPIDPRGAFAPPPPPAGGQPFAPPPSYAGGRPPPGFYPPPPPPFYPALPRQRTGIGAALVTAIAVVIFAGSLVLNLILVLAVAARGDHATLNTTTVLDGDARQKVAVVPIVNSMITAGSYEQLDKLLKQVDADADVKAVVLRIDTPGGEVAPSDQMNHRIAKYKRDHQGVPVVVSMGSMATSGGYYAAVAADYLFAEPTTLTVNVGVYSESFNFAGLMQKYGVEDATIRSSNTPFKNAESPFRRHTPEETAYMQRMIDGFNDQFRAVVKLGRGTRLTAPLLDVCDGRALHADEALKLGAIDQVGYQDDACAYAASKAGLTKPMVVQFNPPSTLAELLTGNASGRSAVPAPTVNGGVHVDLPAVDRKLDRLLDPRPMAMYRP